MYIYSIAAVACAPNISVLLLSVLLTNYQYLRTYRHLSCAVIAIYVLYYICTYCHVCVQSNITIRICGPTVIATDEV